MTPVAIVTASLATAGQYCDIGVGVPVDSSPGQNELYCRYKSFNLINEAVVLLKEFSAHTLCFDL